jgi:hypothetical protein
MSVTVIITGVIKEIFPVETYGNFSKRVIWVEETDQQYPQTYPVEFHNARTCETDPYDLGSKVTCKCDLRGRKWDKAGKTGVIMALSCWDIQRAGGQQSAQRQPQASTRQQTGKAAEGTPQPQAGGYQPINDDEDDLPF